MKGRESLSMAEEATVGRIILWHILLDMFRGGQVHWGAMD